MGPSRAFAPTRLPPTQINLKSKDSKANRDVKTFVHGMLSDEQEETAERKALDIMIELYRKRIWVDHRTVNVIGTGCSSKRTKVAVAAMHFFLGVERKMAEDDAAEAESAASLEVNEHRHSKKTGARVKKVERQRKAKRKRIEVSQGDKEPQPLFPALLVLNDPQSLAESLFRKLRTSNENFEVTPCWRPANPEPQTFVHLTPACPPGSPAGPTASHEHDLSAHWVPQAPSP